MKVGSSWMIIVVVSFYDSQKKLDIYMLYGIYTDRLYLIVIPVWYKIYYFLDFFSWHFLLIYCTVLYYTMISSWFFFFESIMFKFSNSYISNFQIVVKYWSIDWLIDLSLNIILFSLALFLFADPGSKKKKKKKFQVLFNVMKLSLWFIIIWLKKRGMSMKCF